MASEYGSDTLADTQGTAKALLDNLASWNDRADVHANGGYGDLGELAHDPDAVTGVARRDYDSIRPFLPNASLEGLKLLHLQCHIGTDTLCWPRLGAAEVWGLDFSPTALEYARCLADKAHVDVTYVEGDARFATDARNLQGTSAHSMQSSRAPAPSPGCPSLTNGPTRSSASSPLAASS